MTSKSKVQIRLAEEQDLGEVIALLKTNNLPHEDVNMQKIKFILAEVNQKIAGCIGLEQYQDHGLLRSFAVSKDLQNQGIGSKLFDYFISFCSQQGTRNLHLFTVDAHRFFQSRGFSTIDRDNAPNLIKQTTEFTDLCPSSYCSYMRSQMADRRSLRSEN